MTFLIWISVLLLTGYAWLILWYATTWKKIDDWHNDGSSLPATFITVIIIGRNEEKNILHCLDSIISQDYPQGLYEVIYIDDHSTDTTVHQVRSLGHSRVRNFALKDHISPGSEYAFKKAALEVGVAQAKGDLIVTTDADCVAGPSWLKSIASYYESTRCRFITGPVLFNPVKGLFQKFQALEFLGIIGATASGIAGKLHFSANAANLAFEKTLFKSHFNKTAHTHSASGDDMFFIQNVKQDLPATIGFLKSKDAIVTTPPAISLGEFFNQRIRWGTKNSRYQDKTIFLIWAGVWLLHVTLVLNICMLYWQDLHYQLLILSLLILKFCFDYYYLSVLADFFGRRKLTRAIFPAFLINLIYVIFMGVLLNIKSTYQWRGRKLR